MLVWMSIIVVGRTASSMLIGMIAQSGVVIAELRHMVEQLLLSLKVLMQREHTAWVVCVDDRRVPSRAPVAVLEVSQSAEDEVLLADSVDELVCGAAQGTKDGGTKGRTHVVVGVCIGIHQILWAKRCVKGVVQRRS